MSSLQINGILDKLDELRSVFVLGQRAIPFLEEMFVFLKDISALMDDINASIRESTVKMMPNATSRLESVTQATEMATTEILDLIDGALGSVWKLKKRLGESQETVNAIAKADAWMIRLLRASLRDKDDVLLAKVEMIHHHKKALRRKAGEQINADVDALNSISEKLNLIMIALQVQDITAQQLASVNHLIESIRDRMGSLMERLGSGIKFEASRDRPHRFVAFDPNAKYDKSGARQRQADALVAAYEDPQTAPMIPVTPLPSSPTTQDDIDQFFGVGAPANDPPSVESSPASQDAIDQLFGGGASSGDASSGDSSPASQDAIDQLFGGGAPAQPAEDRAPIEGNGPASQDSIDQLFSVPGGGFASQDDIDKLFGS